MIRTIKSKIDNLKIEKVSQPKIFKIALLHIFVHVGGRCGFWRFKLYTANGIVITNQCLIGMGRERCPRGLAKKKLTP